MRSTHLHIQDWGYVTTPTDVFPQFLALSGLRDELHRSGIRLLSIQVVDKLL
jgi:hypothetical protein